MNPCEHNCIPTQDGFECSCREGWNLAEDGKLCEDVDECATQNHDCDPTGTISSCINTEGSYRCVCNTDKGHEAHPQKINQCQNLNECENDPYVCGGPRYCCLDLPPPQRFACVAPSQTARFGLSHVFGSTPTYPAGITNNPLQRYEVQGNGGPQQFVAQQPQQFNSQQQIAQQLQRLQQLEQQQKIAQQLEQKKIAQQFQQQKLAEELLQHHVLYRQSSSQDPWAQYQGYPPGASISTHGLKSAAVRLGDLLGRNLLSHQSDAVRDLRRPDYRVSRDSSSRVENLDVEEKEQSPVLVLLDKDIVDALERSGEIVIVVAYDLSLDQIHDELDRKIQALDYNTTISNSDSLEVGNVTGTAVASSSSPTMFHSAAAEGALLPDGGGAHRHLQLLALLGGPGSLGSRVVGDDGLLLTPSRLVGLQCPAGFQLGADLYRQRMRQQTMDSLHSAFRGYYGSDGNNVRLTPETFTDSLVRNTELLANEAAKWTSEFVNVTPELNAATRNFSSIVADPMNLGAIDPALGAMAPAINAGAAALGGGLLMGGIDRFVYAGGPGDSLVLDRSGISTQLAYGNSDYVA